MKNPESNGRFFERIPFSERKYVHVRHVRRPNVPIDFPLVITYVKNGICVCFRRTRTFFITRSAARGERVAKNTRRRRTKTVSGRRGADERDRHRNALTRARITSPLRNRPFSRSTAAAAVHVTVGWGGYDVGCLTTGTNAAVGRRQGRLSRSRRIILRPIIIYTLATPGRAVYHRGL